MNPARLEIEICMGSSCFSRGNNKSLSIIQAFIQRNQLDAKIELRGCLCQNKCNSGPLLKINGTLYQEVDPVTVADILIEALQSVDEAFAETAGKKAAG